MAKSTSPYLYCDGGDCPLKTGCLRYLPDMDKTRTMHLAWPPYRSDHRGLRCYKYDQRQGLLNYLPPQIHLS